MTSSARAKSVGGTVMPSILAVWGLMTNSYLVDLDNWHVRRFLALQDATDQHALLTICIRDVASIAHQPTRLGQIRVPNRSRAFCSTP